MYNPAHYHGTHGIPERFGLSFSFINRGRVVVVLLVLSLLASAHGVTRRSAKKAKPGGGAKVAKTAKGTTTKRSVKKSSTPKRVSRPAARRTRVVRASLRSRRSRRVRHLVWNPLFRGSHELLVRENVQIDELQLPRIVDDDELEMLEAYEELVPVEDNEALTVASNLLQNRRYCRPWTRDFLEDFSEAFYAEFRRPIIVTSLVRTAEQQKKLRRHNRNAAPEEGETVSTHLTGMTFDMYKRGLSRKQKQWIEEYFLPFKEAGLIEPIEERRQPVFHVTVFDGYEDWHNQQILMDDLARTMRTTEIRTVIMPRTEGEVQSGASN